jgi:hypothetical protein
MKLNVKLLVESQNYQAWFVNEIFPLDKLSTTTPSTNTNARRRFSAKTLPLGLKREKTAENLSTCALLFSS